METRTHIAPLLDAVSDLGFHDSELIWSCSINALGFLGTNGELLALHFRARRVLYSFVWEIQSLGMMACKIHLRSRRMSTNMNHSSPSSAMRVDRRSIPVQKRRKRSDRVRPTVVGGGRGSRRARSRWDKGVLEGAAGAESVAKEVVGAGATVLTAGRKNAAIVFLDPTGNADDPRFVETSSVGTSLAYKTVTENEHIPQQENTATYSLGRLVCPLMLPVVRILGIQLLWNGLALPHGDEAQSLTRRPRGTWMSAASVIVKPLSHASNVRETRLKQGRETHHSVCCTDHRAGYLAAIYISTSPSYRGTYGCARWTKSSRGSSPNLNRGHNMMRTAGGTCYSFR